MKAKYIPVLLLSSLCWTNSFAQQIFRLSQYTQNIVVYNPAAAGVVNTGSAGLIYKKMWSGIEGGPQTTVFVGEKAFSSKNVGAGLVLYNDVTGPTSRSGAEASLSYSINWDNNQKLSFGLSGVMLQERIDKSAIEKDIPGDPLLNASGSTISGDAGAGIFYSSPKWNVGFSAKQLIQSKLDFIKTSTELEGRLYRQFYLMGSYNWKTDEDNVIVPNFLLKLNSNAPADFELGARLIHKNLFWVGFNYHKDQDYSAFAGLNFGKKYSIGYAFDQYKTPLSVFDNGGDAHEVSLKYYFKK